MTGWNTRKVFWSAVAVTDGNGITLDGRALRTPGKAPLILPSRALAQAVAAEWVAQRVEVDPLTMPLTRIANSAIDRVAPQAAEVASLIAAYGESDLLNYRATGPEALVARQAAGWDPVLAWAAQALAAPLRSGQGIVHIPQDPRAIAALAALTRALDPFRLAAFHDLVAISGSLILGFAVAEGHLAPESAWALSRIDEDWQAEQWGQDAEAAEAAARKHADFLTAARFFSLCAEAVA
jgi:chaperone required for assembly of F1-ATPase